MSDLRPRRRKFGVLMLIFACLAMGAWIRSRNIHDEIRFEGTEFTETLSSHLGSMYWLRTHVHRTDNFSFWNRFHRQHTQIAPAQVWKEEQVGSNWRWHLLGIGVRDCKSLNGRIYYSLFVTPYWAIVIPLTLTSAWLLLTKSKRWFTPNRDGTEFDSQRPFKLS